MKLTQTKDAFDTDIINIEYEDGSCESMPKSVYDKQQANKDNPVGGN